MSLTKVTYSMIDGAAFSVTDYGADPSGTSDSTAALNAAIDAAYASITNTGTSYSLTLVIPQPQWNGAYAYVYLPPGKYLLTGVVTQKSNVILVGNNAMLFMDGGTITMSNFWTGMVNLAIVSPGTTATAITMSDIDLTRRSDTPICYFENISFKNFDVCFTMDNTLSSNYTMVRFNRIHTENCIKFSDALRSDNATIRESSFRTAFSQTSGAFFTNYGNVLSIEDCVFVPWPSVTNPTPINDARYVDNYGGVVIRACRFGNEDLNAGNNNVTNYRDAKNVCIVYNYSSWVGYSTSGGETYEAAAVNLVSITDCQMFHRNVGAVTLFEVPSQLVIKGNRGVSGATFNANLEITRPDYLIYLNPFGMVYPTADACRHLIRFDVDMPSNFFSLLPTVNYSSPLWESVTYDNGTTRYFCPDAVVGTQAQFTIDLRHLPKAHFGKIRVYGKPRNGSEAVAMMEIEYRVRVYYDTAATADKKQIDVIGTPVAIAADVGTPVYGTPAIAQFEWAGIGATTTDLDLPTVRLWVDDIGEDTEQYSAYAVLMANPIQNNLF